MSEVLALIEHDRGEAAETAYQAVGLARTLVERGVGSSVTTVLIGADADRLARGLRAYGVTRVLHGVHPELTDYAPEAWGDVLAGLIAWRRPAAVVATGSDRGNEVIAHAAAATDLAFAANVVDVRAPRYLAPGVELTRVRWGGSLLEHAELDDPVYLMTGAPHAFSGEPGEDSGAGEPTVEVVDVILPETAARTRIVERVPVPAGVDLTDAPVVVSGGRGVGSAEGFAVLEELALLLGGAVGCSRVATNNGWRPHGDQVGQTGKRIAPQLYIACGISGAIQHWVGMMAAEHVMAINIDRDANLVGKAEYAVIGDLHEIVPAVIGEIRRRRARSERSHPAPAPEPVPSLSIHGPMGAVP